jgi:beta,beta-carotene 9',10'-dioxygenase
MSTTATRTRTGYELGFTTLDEETSVDRLDVEGSLPEWLTGTLVRLTPAGLDVGGRRLRHWFDGLAMLNVFSFGDGQVAYANRYLQTEEYRHAKEHGELRSGQFATDPCRSIFKRVAAMFSASTDNTNVNVTRLGERFIAMTETPMPVEFDPETLETLGGLKFADGLKGHITTAHPHHDAERDELVSYVTHFGRKSSYRVYALPAGSTTRRQIASLKVDEPAYMHSFAMTERYVVLVEFPLVVDPLRLALSGRPFIDNYRWKPELGTRFTVIDRHSGELRGRYEGDAFFAFHHVNAWEEGSELVIDVCAYDDPEIIRALELERITGPDPRLPAVELRRYRVPLDGGEVRWEPLVDEPLELPRIDYGRFNTRPHRFVYGIGGSRDDDQVFNRLVKADVGSGSTRIWRDEECYAGEPVFVRSPEASGEDDGVVLSVVLDGREGKSFLLVLDAGSFEERARAKAPHHIPAGFHGAYFRETG